MNTTALYRGKRNYELSNHLGNVQVVISDKRKSVCDEELGVEYFVAEVLSAVDYYPFGKLLPDRQWYASNDTSQFVNGFNGMRYDHEINQKGRSVDYGARIFDVDLGRWLSLDPLQAKYPGVSAYVFVRNSPILFADLGGRDFWLGGNREQAIIDVYSLVPVEYHSRINVSESGQVILDLTANAGGAIPMLENGEYADAGFQLLVNLTTANEKYLYLAADDTYYVQAKANKVTQPIPKKKNITKDENHVDNISINSRFARSIDQDIINSSSELPQAGFDGMVVVQSNYEWTENNEPKPRSSVVFHELWENYERTTNDLPYGTPIYDRNGVAVMRDLLNPIWDQSKMSEGAHGKACKAEERFHQKSKHPGSVD